MIDKALRTPRSPPCHSPVNVGLLVLLAVVFAAVSRVMTDPERILAPELWESLEQLPSRDGKKRHADVVLRDGSVVKNVHFYEYRLISVGQRLPFRVPFKADQIASIRRRST